jgi:hypothetical protein
VKFLAVSHNTADPMPFVAQESEKTAALERSGVFDTVLLKADFSGAVIVLNAADRTGARAVLDQLPLVKNGVARFDLTEVVEPRMP